jgi:predicted dithiol-disulfide oxidoreductase (DUF899 family)
VNGRGDEQMGNRWNYLDITALGFQEQRPTLACRTFSIYIC